MLANAPCVCQFQRPCSNDVTCIFVFPPTSMLFSLIISMLRSLFFATTISTRFLPHQGISRGGRYDLDGHWSCRKCALRSELLGWRPCAAAAAAEVTDAVTVRRAAERRWGRGMNPGRVGRKLNISWKVYACIIYHIYIWLWINTYTYHF